MRTPRLFSQVPYPTLQPTDWIEKGIFNHIKKQEIDYSFPSSHAQTTTSFLTALILEFGMNWITGILVFVVASVCLSRITLGVHYPTCVLAGAVLGVASTLLLKHSEVLEWYTDELSMPEQISYATLFVLILSLTFELVRRAFPPAEDQSTWYSGRETKVNEIRDHMKNNFALFSLLGSAIGSAYTVEDNKHLQLRCTRALVKQKTFRTERSLSAERKAGWTKSVLDTCYALLRENIGSPIGHAQKTVGTYRYYETAFLHRFIPMHKLHDMEVFFPLIGNALGAKEILCELHRLYEEEGYDNSGHDNADFYFATINDDFWLSPESVRANRTREFVNSTIEEEESEILRVNIYIPWIVEDVHPIFDRFLERFNDLNLTYSLNWGKTLPQNASLMSRVLENYPHLEEWKRFVVSRDPDGIFLSDYWRSVFF